MDKLKTALDVVKKHHFWMLLGLILVSGVLIYVAAATGLKSEYERREKAIVDSWKQTTQITTEPEHPNEARIKAIEEVRQRQEELNNLAWRELYREQKRDNPWPGVLGQEFLSVIRDLKSNQEIGFNHREIYRDRIEAALPRLFEIVDYRRLVPREPGEIADGASAAEGGVPGFDGTEYFKTVGIVDWNEADRMNLEQEFKWTDMPSSLRVRLAQEDYWVYKALLNIIRETNRGAETQSSAAIKRIEALEIGKRAADSIASRKGLELVAGGSGSGGTGGGVPSDGPMGMGGGMGPMPPMGPTGAVDMGPAGAVDMGPAGAVDMGPTGGMPAAADSDEFLLDRRYVKDERLTPLSAQEAKEQKQFKRMPVRMELVIDQSRIPDLLVECANAAMPVEVVQLQVNPDQATPVPGTGGSFGGGMGGPMGGMGGPMGGMGGPMGGPAMGRPMMGPDDPGMGMGGGMRGGMGMGGQFGEQEKSPYEVTIEIRGIIYIYQPSPLEEGREEVEKAEEISEAAPAVPPASNVVPTPAEPGPAPITP